MRAVTTRSRSASPCRARPRWPAEADLARPRLGCGLAAASRRACRWPPARPATGHCAPTAVVAALPICYPTHCRTAAVLLPSLPRAVAQLLPLLLSSPRTWPCPCCRRHRLAIYGTTAAHVVLGRGREHVPSGRDGW